MRLIYSFSLSLLKMASTRIYKNVPHLCIVNISLTDLYFNKKVPIILHPIL